MPDTSAAVATIVAAVEARAERSGFALDAAQREALTALAQIGAADPDPDGPPQSVYLHGGAGRGKSWLAEAVYEALPTERRVRVHIHGFFDELHRSIHEHRATHRDAVERAIDAVTGDAEVLLFDELHVHDVGDARLVTRLLEHVFARGLTVIATSNYAPGDLLSDPVWHHLFLPGIALIEANMRVVPVEGGVDYRTVTTDHGHGFAAGTWTQATVVDDGVVTALTVRGRIFAVTSAAHGHLVASFAQLCAAATSTIEFLEWAREFERWTITGIPDWASAGPDAQQRFITLIDVLVAADIPTTFVAEVPLSRFLTAVSQRPDTFRMTSRLHLLTPT